MRVVFEEINEVSYDGPQIDDFLIKDGVDPVGLVLLQPEPALVVAEGNIEGGLENTLEELREPLVALLLELLFKYI